MLQADINFCHIAPTEFLDLTESNGAHLVLAHLIESDPSYVAFYQNLDDGKYIIMDNSAFEMYKQGREMYPTERLMDMAQLVGADCIVMSDYPGEPGQKTIEAAERTIKEYKKRGFDVFFVPQSKVGDLDDYLNTVKWGLDNPDINLIGLSILGAPNAFGVERDNKLQRFLSRWKILRLLEADGYLHQGNFGRFHCLGMVDGPNEIELLAEFADYIFSWDSSAAVWAGLHSIKFDNSPTGLVDGKFEKEVDFGVPRTARMHNKHLAIENINYINRLTGGQVI